MTAVVYDGLARLPPFNPDDDGGDHLPWEPARLREEIAAADAVLFCTPEYAGTLPGSFKNPYAALIGRLGGQQRDVPGIAAGDRPAHDDEPADEQLIGERGVLIPEGLLADIAKRSR